MCSDVVVVTSIGSQYPAQMRLTKNDDMIQALAADRPDQPFGKAILPRRCRCGRLVPDAHGAQSACDDRAIDLIPIAKEIFWGIIPREGRKGLALLQRSVRPIHKPLSPSRISGRAREAFTRKKSSSDAA